jgi:hypothetical protein
MEVAPMIELLRREFTVQVPPEAAWRHLARIEEWPSWARHIKQVQAAPKGELAAVSSGIIHLTNGVKSKFTMTEFNPHRNWKWVGGFLWSTVHYDHIFEPLDAGQTKLIFVIEAEGLGVRVLGRLFAHVYNKNLDTAIPLLVAEINSSQRDSFVN